MAIVQPETLVAAFPVGHRVLALDLGTKRIGLALSDGDRRVASPLPMLPRRRLALDLEALASLVAARGIGGFLLGLPLNMDGSPGPRVQATRQFARDLGRRLDLPIALWDERLSTAAVERAMISADLTRRQRGQRIDSAAAAWLLQGYLDFLQNRTDREAADTNGHQIAT